MGTAGVHVYMPDTGRDDIAPLPQRTVRWLMTQNIYAWLVMMADANASGNIPWHFTDERTGRPINGQTYPTFWNSPTAAEYGAQFLQPSNGWA